MVRKPTEIEVAGEFGETEEAILIYLYDHPGYDSGTMHLMRALKPQSEKSPEQRKQAYQEIQHAIETLIVAKLIKGKRRSTQGDVYYDDVTLTMKGEAESIKQKRRVKKIILDIPRPDRGS